MKITGKEEEDRLIGSVVNFSYDLHCTKIEESKNVSNVSRCKQSHTEYGKSRCVETFERPWLRRGTTVGLVNRGGGGSDEMRSECGKRR